MQQHFRILGWILLVLGILGTLGVIAGTAFFGLITWGMGQILAISSSIFIYVALVGVVTVLQIVAGAGLLKQKSWARTVTIIVSILALPGFPFWTAVGVYGFWLMFSAEGGQAWISYTRGAEGVE
jgi:hypothetical protein